MDLAAATDAGLVGLARAGDRDAFGMLYLRHHSAAWRVACVVAGWSADAEVALIEGFTTVFSALPAELDAAVDFRRSLLACVRQAALDRLAACRRRRVEAPAAAAAAIPEPDEVVLSGPEHHLLRSSLLTPPMRRPAPPWLPDAEAEPPTAEGIMHPRHPPRRRPGRGRRRPGAPLPPPFDGGRLPPALPGRGRRRRPHPLGPAPGRRSGRRGDAGDHPGFADRPGPPAGRARHCPPGPGRAAGPEPAGRPGARRRRRADRSRDRRRLRPGGGATRGHDRDAGGANAVRRAGPVPTQAPR